jgi:hypothetical protein
MELVIAEKPLVCFIEQGIDSSKSVIINHPKRRAKRSLYIPEVDPGNHLQGRHLDLQKI